jgi:ABC-2 type transport system permease protein
MSLKEDLRVTLATSYWDIWIYYRYPMNIVSALTLPLGFALVAFLFQNLVSAGEFKMITGYALDYGPFALIGIGVYWLDTFGWQAGIVIEREATWGTIEPNLLMPIRRITYVLGLILGRLFTTSILSFTMILIAIAWISFQIQISAVALCILIIILCAVTSFGMGLIMCSIALRYKQVAQFSYTITLFTQFLTGAFIPLESIPCPIRYASYAFPVTWAIDSFRSQLMGSDSIIPLPYEIIILASFSAALIVIGMLVFGYFERKTRESGMIGTY